MQRVWLIINRASRSVADGWEEMLGAAFASRQVELIDTTDFPERPLPTPDELRVANVDVVAVAAGDGTINAAAHALDDWKGALLVLPGGTMNLLSRTLHGLASAEEIIRAVSQPPLTKRLPTVDAPGGRAVVGAIIGPGASWVHAREAVRHGRWGMLRRAIRLAYLRSLSRSVRLRDGDRRSRGYRAVFVRPREEGLEIVRVRAAGWTDGVRLGLSYLIGQWQHADGIEVSTADTLDIAETKPTQALFDGEPLRLPPGARLQRGETRLRFVTTL